MPKPHDVKGVQRIMGIINYLTRFLNDLTDICRSINSLTRILSGIGLYGMEKFHQYTYGRHITGGSDH